MDPIGYVVLFTMRDTGKREPAALTKCDGERKLLARSCFTMFPTEADAIAEVERHAPGGNLKAARVCAVFPAGIAAPHHKDEEAASV